MSFSSQTDHGEQDTYSALSNGARTPFMSTAILDVVIKEEDTSDIPHGNSSLSPIPDLHLSQNELAGTGQECEYKHLSQGLHGQDAVSGYSSPCYVNLIGISKCEKTPCIPVKPTNEFIELCETGAHVGPSSECNSGENSGIVPHNQLVPTGEANPNVLQDHIVTDEKETSMNTVKVECIPLEHCKDSKRTCELLPTISKNWLNQQDLHQANGNKKCKEGHQRFECTICMKKCISRQNLKDHTTVHTGERPYECSICHKTFKHRGNLYGHRKLHTGENPYKCDICMKAFTTRYQLRVHVWKHTGEAPHKCEDCKQRFATSTQLMIHRRIHTGERPYECNVCQSRFMVKVYLTKHMKRTHGEKKFKCSFCSWKFTTLKAMQSHVMVHTGEKPYKCSMCQATFARSYSLSFHIRVVHNGVKPHKCESCSRSFAKMNRLRSHTRKAHGT